MVSGCSTAVAMLMRHEIPEIEVIQLCEGADGGRQLTRHDVAVTHNAARCPWTPTPTSLRSSRVRNAGERGHGPLSDSACGLERLQLQRFYAGQGEQGGREGGAAGGGLVGALVIPVCRHTSL